MTATNGTDSTEEKNIYTVKNILLFILCSLFGIFLIFVPITVNGSSSIPLDHIMTFIKTNFPYALKIVTCLIILVGVFLPLKRGTWKKNGWTIFFQIFKFFAVPFTIMYFFNIGPWPFMDASVIPYFFKNVILSATLVQLTGAVCLGFLAKFGLFEFIGVFVRPVMRKFFKLPGLAAVNAVSSFVGSYTIGAIISNSLYHSGKYTDQELGILLTGFGTNSATFLILMATITGVMGYWTILFWVAFVMCCVLTAITCRIYPLTKLPQTYAEGSTPNPELPFTEKVYKKAFHDGIDVAAHCGGFWHVVWESFMEGLEMCLGLLPIMGSLSIVALIILYFTPVFTILGYIGYPFALLVGYGQNAVLVGRAAIIELIDVIVPCTAIIGLDDIIAKITITIMGMCTVIFFCGTIPCFSATDCKLTVIDYIIIGLERILIGLVVITLILRGLALVGVIPV